MAETSASEEEVSEQNTAAAADMVVESSEPAALADPKSKQKRAREEEEDQSHEDKAASKKQKVEKGKEQQQQEEKTKPSGPVKLGYKTFGSSVEIFDYFYKFIHYWPLDLDVNEYEHTMLLGLLKNGHTEPAEKIGVGIRAFQVRKHPKWLSRCFFLIREDGSVDDFSFRKCVNHILPLPEEMQPKPGADKQLGSKKKYHSRPGGRGRGRLAR